MWPFASRGFTKSKAESTDAMPIQIDAAAKCRPGQILLPNPIAANSASRISDRKLPSSLSQRSGMNASGSGNSLSSCKIALTAKSKGARREH